MSSTFCDLTMLPVFLQLAGEFEFGLDACGVSELVFYNSESTAPVDMTFRRNFNYTRLAVDEDGKSTFDPRFDFSGETSGKVPWKSIGLALFLLLFGCVLLLLSLSIFTGYMGGDVSQAYGLFGLGTLTFLPGMLVIFTSSFMALKAGKRVQTCGE
ncbi:putative transmembrane protein [Helianthus annuus]|nr:putative transmembrane protein [Helianthus annuus]